VVALPTLEKEIALLKQGYYFIAGIDEAGRGAWAGPVVAAAVILPQTHPHIPQALQNTRDSKQLTPRQRDKLFQIIQENALSIGVGVSSPAYIDRQRIIAATRHAMQQAITRLHPRPQFLLIDALSLPDVSIPQQAFFKADVTSLSVAAASIVAKVTRDRLMVKLSEQFPGYGFAQHKGYGTQVHQTALARLGPCKIHRHTFAPIKKTAATF